MAALVRYQIELLIRSHRWLPPFLAYTLLMGIGISGDQAMMDSFGYNAAMLVPVTAWFVRCALTADPAPARACLVAALGSARVQLASLVAALTAGLLLAGGGVLVVLLVSGHTVNPPARQEAPGTAAGLAGLAGGLADGRRPEVPASSAALAGLLAAVACVLVGLAVGALCSRPVLLRAQYGILATLGLAVLVLVVGGSPANSAVRALVGGARLDRVDFPVAALLLAAALAVLVAAGTAVLAGRRTE